jgi:glycosyltransferase involved in cell wall biosynthesis
VPRIALVCEPPDGGVAQHVAELARGLPAHGHETVVFAPADYLPGPALAAEGHDVRTLSFVRDYAHPHRDARALAALAQAARGADLVHAHSAKAGVLGRLAAALAGRPAVYTPHGLPFVGEMSPARRRFGVLAERALTPVTAVLIGVCEAERRIALGAGLDLGERFAVVHNGCRPCPAPPAPHAAPVVGTVSTLRPAKRLDVLLDAAPHILAAVPEATVRIAGDGPEGGRLRAHPAAADSRVVFVPFAPPAARQLRELDVFVLCSGWEAFPIGVLEAMACGVPQVASDVGGVREAVVPETGLVVPPGDPPALAEAVIALLRDPARRAAMATASRARHAERFTVERMVAETAAVYARALSTPRGRRGPRAAWPRGSRRRGPATSRPRTGSRT